MLKNLLIKAAIQASGSKSTTTRGLKKYRAKNPREVSENWIKLSKGNVSTIRDRARQNASIITGLPVNHRKTINLARRIKIISFTNSSPLHKSALELVDIRRRARTSARARIDPFHGVRETQIDHGPYSRRCRFSKMEYIGEYHSCIVVSKSGNVAWHLENKQIKWFRRAPYGLKWGIDEHGTYLISRDGTEYHLTEEDFVHPQFVQNIKENLAEARRRRRENLLKRKQQDKIEKELSKCTVMLQDARLAGYCLTGVTAWAMRNLRLKQSEITNLIFSIPAKKLILFMEKDNRIKNILYRAYARETTIAI